MLFYADVLSIENVKSASSNMNNYLIFSDDDGSGGWSFMAACFCFLFGGDDINFM